MAHRGGINADGRTGDGCGVLMQKPDTFLRTVADEAGWTLASAYAVGTIFLSRDAAYSKRGRETLERCLAAEGLQVLGWRPVPIREQHCGELAQLCRPTIEQLFVNLPENWDEAHAAARLFVARKRAELLLTDDPDFQVCSLATGVISYKALSNAEDFAAFFPDLSDPRLQTAIATFHLRYSTNTLPHWALAQPFRLLAHNGEINTIVGNRNWAQICGAKLRGELLPELDELGSLVNQDGSDSSALDNMLELLCTGGVDLFRALRLLLPPAWQQQMHPDMSPAQRAFYEYHATHMEPWDGPTSIVLTEGRYAVCLLDRNGLRPVRYEITRDDVITIASETGVRTRDDADVVTAGRLGPGGILAVDTASGQLLHSYDIEERLARQHPYQQWLAERVHTLQPLTDAAPKHCEAPLAVQMKQFEFSAEEADQVLAPLANAGQEATSSMGDDLPSAVLSIRVRPLYDYFRQQFAQVTNPAIDPLRETLVMSLRTWLASKGNLLHPGPEQAERIALPSPILLPEEFAALGALETRWAPRELLAGSHAVGQPGSLAAALDALADEAEQVARDGTATLLLADWGLAPDRVPIHSLLAVGAVHTRLIECKLRGDVNLIVASGSARDAHQIATLFGYGATAVYPHLAYPLIEGLAAGGQTVCAAAEACANYRHGIEKGLLKILSKMGISDISSYRGAALFEAVGLSAELVARCFKGTPNTIGGADLSDLERDAEQLGELAWQPLRPLERGGLGKFVFDTEYHDFNPDVVSSLQKFADSGKPERYRTFKQTVEGRPVAMLRDLLRLRDDAGDKALPLEQVEPMAAILRRFDSAGMSLGALSPEAHEVLAMAMNQLGGRSNCGEGGEDAARFGTERNSRIKQVASGRFGVTPHYLVNAEVLQIKIAQGAKPGEGGQLPGNKVDERIAGLRHVLPGTTLISPSPHHDIYSIEDLAQLVYDLKAINPDARVSVKLVSSPGVGTIAIGVAKAGADMVTISGGEGGTGASPLSSIRYAGSPWELGLSDAHQALCEAGFRDRILVQTDGGLKTGTDIIKAALLGADSFGFGTAPLVAAGCKFLRLCHTNRCPTGIATQDEWLRQHHFHGSVQKVTRFFEMVAQDVREQLASLGYARLEDLIGRTELLEAANGDTPRQRRLRLAPLLHTPDIAHEQRHCSLDVHHPAVRSPLCEHLARAAEPLLDSGGDLGSHLIGNADRAIGARVSGMIAERHGAGGMPGPPLRAHFEGAAGQSFGAWNAAGLELSLSGVANDYVGKGMNGGRISLRVPLNSQFESHRQVIAGNTCLYGATGGVFYAAGQLGERCAVRNSGCHAVIEGAGHHCCEYMTGGVVAVLGSCGVNFGAGMTGGFAFVLDLAQDFDRRCNTDLVGILPLDTVGMRDFSTFLWQLVQDFVDTTGSPWGQQLLERHQHYQAQFQVVLPRAFMEQPERLLLSEQRCRDGSAAGIEDALVPTRIPQPAAS